MMIHLKSLPKNTKLRVNLDIKLSQVVGVAVCVEQTGSALRDPEEGGGPSNSLAVSAGQSESDAELPQPARERERSHLPGGARAHHEPVSGSPCCQLKPRSPTPLTG